MKKPPDLWIWLVTSWPIQRLSVHQTHIGDDRSETYVKIKGGRGEKSVISHKASELLNFRLDYNSIAEPKPHVKEAVRKWQEFEKQNSEDLNEFKRLKEKLGL